MQHIVNDRPGNPDRLPPARRIRRVATGVGLIGFSVLLVPEEIVDPTGSSTFQEAAAQHPDGLYAAALLLLTSAVLTFPAICGILHQARDRGALVANIAAVFTALGALGHAALGAINLVMRALAGGDVTAMRAVEERFSSDVPVGVVGLTLLMSFGVGISLLAWAAWRAGIIGLWGPVLVTGVVVAHNVLPEHVPGAVSIIALGLITAVFGRLGVRTIMLADAAWEARSGAPTTPANNLPETSTLPASPAPGQSRPSVPGPTATPGAGTVDGCPRPAARW